MWFWEFISFFGDIVFWLLLTILFPIIFYLDTKKVKKKISWFISTVLPSVIISRFITEILKRIFQTQRPCIGPNCPTTFSFPSGHATVIFAAAMAVSLHHKNWRITTLMMVFAVLVSVSRLMLGLHRLEDVIAGSIIGILTAVLVQRVYDNYRK
jgi:undecaprenyl-diphosphatase